jgi:hypothetical protein
MAERARAAAVAAELHFTSRAQLASEVTRHLGHDQVDQANRADRAGLAGTRA